MKKITLILFLFNIGFAKIDYQTYEGYVDDISNYSIESINPTYNPFYITHIEKNVKKIFKPKPKLKIFAILNNKILLNIKTNNRNKNIWLKVGESAENYKLIKITKESVLLKHNNKIEVLKINKNKFKVRVSK